AGSVSRRSVGREGVGIARLTGLVDGSVTADQRNRAIVVATVRVDRVAVVAGLAAVHDTVAAERTAGGPAGARTARTVRGGGVGREGVRVARLAGLVDEAVAAARQLAIVPATVRVDVVAVVALLAAVRDAVAAEGATGVPAGARTARTVRGGGVGREGVRVARLAGLVDGAVTARELAV